MKIALCSPGLVLAAALSRAQAGGGPVHVVIDAIGLKVFDAGEWLSEKHGARRQTDVAQNPHRGEFHPALARSSPAN